VIAMLARRTGIAPRELLAEPEITEHLLEILQEEDEAAEAEAHAAELRAQMRGL
jgi:hypothetical protein